MREREKLKIVTKYELLKHIRRKRFYGALAITVLAVVLMIGLYRGLDVPGQIRERIKKQMLGVPEPEQDRILDQAKISDNPEFFAMFVTSMGTLAVLGAVFFAGDAIASEFEQKTGYILFPNPVKRTTIVIGKYLACFVATGIVLAVAYLISIFALVVFYGEVPVGVFGSFAIALMLACFIISLAFTFSAALRGGMGATILTLITYMVIFPIFSGGLSAIGYDPWFIPDRAGDAIAATYNISYENVFGWMTGEERTLAGMIRASQNPTLSFFVLMIYAAVLFIISLFIANRREML